MSRQISSKMWNALRDVKDGYTPYKASKRNGVAQSGISRQLNKPPEQNCPTCGRKLKQAVPNVKETKMKNKLFFESGNDDLGLQVVETTDGNLSFSANNEWCGDTESGFGATVTVCITLDDAKRLIDALTKWVKA
jgi:hypothetical protein